jgi:hypothetical protein
MPEQTPWRHGPFKLEQLRVESDATHTNLQLLQPALRSSHSSTPACTNPSPQTASLQPIQPSVVMVLPSSHSSPGSLNPLPQLTGRHVPDRQKPLMPPKAHAPPSFVAVGAVQR